MDRKDVGRTQVREDFGEDILAGFPIGDRQSRNLNGKDIHATCPGQILCRRVHMSSQDHSRYGTGLKAQDLAGNGQQLDGGGLELPTRVISDDDDILVHWDVQSDKGLLFQ